MHFPKTEYRCQGPHTEGCSSPVVSKRTRGKKNPLVLRQEPELSSLKLGTLEELMQARRSVLDPPWEGSNLIPGDLIIRSHEGPDAREKRSGLAGTDLGYTIDHDVQSGKLITIFSAPDYPQFQATRERYRNKGAYIILQAPDLSDPQFRSFEAVTPRPKANPYYDFENEMDKSAMDGNEEQAASH
ncbi:PREDICTED: serine/threonine-protein phosphatase 7-like [Brassica oleracea var. oleracea]|uniref:serine/threonine-protein phosphatase 7-like n=1 Tax=Brassica oleracea var. oleracea TaxID=109376 RepID=UPI0006A71C0B|nr:PREDICTED: serine/threonine-protein phosphatase 7-like [Brassica oleracea var. oleracea]